MYPYINIHTHHHSNSERVIEVVNRKLDAEKDTYGVCSYGLHPWVLLNYTNDLALLRIKLTESNCVAIGECGLDRLRSDVGLEVQEIILINQLEIARLIKKPVIIHCVKAFDRLVPILKEHAFSVPVVIHGFNNNIEILKSVKNECVSFSFGKALLKEGSNAQKSIKQLSLQEFFLETDNEKDLSIEQVYLKAAELLQIDLEVLKEEMFKNYKRIIDAGF